MRFSNDGSAWSAWQGYAPTASWTITGSPGPNTVYVEVQDPDGGTGQAYASISYDGTGASLASSSGVSGTYDGQAVQFVQSPIVTAALGEPSGSVSMETSFDNRSWSQPEDAAASVSVVLPSSQGLHAVFARYFNQDNVGTNVGPDYFVLDTTPPVIQSATWLDNAAVTNGGSATLVLQASDNITGASALQVAVTGAASWSGALPVGGQIPLSVTGSGYVTVTVTVTDQAGNSTRTSVGIYDP